MKFHSQEDKVQPLMTRIIFFSLSFPCIKLLTAKSSKITKIMQINSNILNLDAVKVLLK